MPYCDDCPEHDENCCDICGGHFSWEDAEWRERGDDDSEATAAVREAREERDDLEETAVDSSRTRRSEP
jgi:hypothetical protein